MHPLRIIIFEDEYLLANDLKQQIGQYSYEVTGIFRKAEEGLRFLRETRQPENLPDVVLMDISLAGKMSGIEAARIIAENYNFALVFLTGMSQMKVFEEAFITRPHAFLIKPFDVHQALFSIQLAYYQKTLENRLIKHQVELEEKIAERTRELKLSKDLAEEEIRRKCAMLETLGSQVHEPLIGILDNNSALKKNAGWDPKVQRCTQQIEKHIRRLNSIMNSITGLKDRV